MVELVWDADRSGTALTSTGAAAEVGDESVYSPEDLIAMAAASCLMRTFLRLADAVDVPLMSYASTARLESGPAQPVPRVVVHVYVVAASYADEATIRQLCRASTETSVVANLLGGHLELTCDVRVLCQSVPMVH